VYQVTGVELAATAAGDVSARPDVVDGLTWSNFGQRVKPECSNNKYSHDEMEMKTA
jgi:hypothetical protein